MAAPTRTVTLAITWDPEDHADPARWDWPTLLDLPDRDYVQLVSSDADESSSVSRQHYIDTGVYLTTPETLQHIDRKDFADLIAEVVAEVQRNDDSSDVHSYRDLCADVARRLDFIATDGEVAVSAAEAAAAVQAFEATLPEEAPALRAAFLARQERLAADPQAALAEASARYHEAAGDVTLAALAVIDKAVKDRWPASTGYVLQGFFQDDGGVGIDLDEVWVPGPAGRLSVDDGNDDVEVVNESLWDALSYLAETTGEDYAHRTVFGVVGEEAGE